MNLLGIAMILLADGATLIALLACVALLVPAAEQRAREILNTSLWRAFLLGLVNFLFFGALMFVFARIGQGGRGIVAAILFLIALLDGLGMTLLFLLGLSALTGLVGERMGEASSALGRHLRGSVLVVLAGLTPWLGWFVFSPIVLLTGFGAAIKAIVRRK